MSYICTRHGWSHLNQGCPICGYPGPGTQADSVGTFKFYDNKQEQIDQLKATISDLRAQLEAANDKVVQAEIKCLKHIGHEHCVTPCDSIRLQDSNHNAWLQMKDRAEAAESDLAQSQELVKSLISERDKALTKWYAHQKNVPCFGCELGHDTFWKSVIESPQWKEWENVADWDTAECASCGHISSEHFQAFLKFCVAMKNGEYA